MEEACRNGDLQLVKQLVKTEKTKEYEPLLAACRRGHLEILKVLVDNGYPLHKPQSTAPTPMEYACYLGYTPIVEFLLLQGVKKPGFFELTPLHYACEQGHLGVVKVLLRHGNSLYSQDIHGVTPVGIATREIGAYITYLRLYCALYTLFGPDVSRDFIDG